MGLTHGALSSAYLGGVFHDNTHAAGIALMTIFALFPVEFLTMRYATPQGEDSKS